MVGLEKFYAFTHLLIEGIWCELIKDGLNLGYYISFSGVITFKNAKPEIPVSHVPLNKILIELEIPLIEKKSSASLE